ncbi:hypothetical protein QKU48_gp0346 [Fadolivirus algeromassiliense]|jgi:hypothetical protein|uniref:Uncharacterized protein n=1 Tax=Fadolivirus FV1/VV64 TaxID=3070911 RepID=A0A7D3QUY4_9VIRU|nr:hypothetical protein QKU48_gp0346 [Fadolivirus algeromassiliense]QKF93804.1 hypothetical protein Fadolivirus_1_346 [Fadolivirus FV1/VV64]
MNNYDIWPPIKGRIIMVNQPNNIFIGKVYKPINNGYIVLLMNNNTYIENSISEMDIKPLSLSRHGIFLLKPEYKWKYINEDYLNFGSDKISDINYIANKYMNFKNRYLYGGQGNETQIMSTSAPIDPQTQQQLKELEQIVGTEQQLSEIPPFAELIDEKPRLKNDCTGLADVPLNYVVSKTQNDQSKQPEPLMDDLFSEYNDKEIQLEITDLSLVEQPVVSDQGKIREILKRSSLPVHASELELVVSPLLAVENVIRTKSEEIGEGNKIIYWLKEKLNIPDNKGINGLEFKIHKGYVHIFRKHIGIQTLRQSVQTMTPQGPIDQPQYGLMLGKDIITEQNTPGLQYFKWQYGLPIDYDTLKYVLFQNKFQENLVKDKSQLEEAKRILGQEYLIAFQPEPLYVMWTVKRLIESWYADDILNNNIRKIKVLINLYRARNNEHNRLHGILPVIVIYPKYGENSAELVIKSLLNHFWKQIPAGWKCSHPTYFVRLTNFLYYTNGAIDLKLYHRKVLENSNESLMNRTYREKYTQFDSASDLGEIKVIDDLPKQPPQ